MGVTLDRSLSFTEHYRRLRQKTAPRLRQLLAVSGRDWGADETTLRSIYLTYIRSALEYAGGAWMQAASKSALNNIQVVQNAAARTITGCCKGSYADEVEREAKLTPLSFRAQIKSASLYERAMRRDSDDPLFKAAIGVSTKRLSSVKGWRDSGQNIAITCELNTLPRERNIIECTTPPWVPTVMPTISTDAGEKVPKEAGSETRRQVAESYLQSCPPVDTVVYTDGSVINGTSNGGGGIIIKWPDGQTTTTSIAAGRWCTSYRAEIAAILEALDTVQKEGKNRNAKRIRIHTDSQAALSRLQSTRSKNRDYLIGSIWSKVSQLSAAGFTLHFQWVPSHCGIQGNEEAAKSGTTQEQRSVAINLQTAVTTISRIITEMWKKNTRDSWHTTITKYLSSTDLQTSQLTRSQAVDVHQLRVGKSPLLSSYLHTIGRSDTGSCPDCARKMTMRATCYSTARYGIMFDTTCSVHFLTLHSALLIPQD